ncbi:hypothetical protein AB0I55_27025 [Actinocatenispora sera]|uniref:hypothetical protein n=1 Tax=Actinocatenispora sera TaxID=390989 RepID=UPI0033F95F8E
MDRGNRILFTIVGAVLLIAGLAVGFAGFGLIPPVDSSTRLLPDSVRGRWHDWGVGAWIVAAAVGVLLAVLGVLLVRGQFRSGRGRPMPDLLLTDPALTSPSRGVRPANPVAAPAEDDGAGAGAVAAGGDDERGTGPGRTRVRTAALVHGFERDLARHPKVRRVNVLLAGDAGAPRVYARLELRSGVDVSHVQAYLSESLARFTATTGLAPTDVDVVVQLTDRDQLRVH